MKKPCVLISKCGGATFEGEAGEFLHICDANENNKGQILVYRGTRRLVGFLCTETPYVEMNKDTNTV
jgi:hypothetical protein